MHIHNNSLLHLCLINLLSLSLSLSLYLMFLFLAAFFFTKYNSYYFTCLFCYISVYLHYIVIVTGYVHCPCDLCSRGGAHAIRCSRGSAYANLPSRRGARATGATEEVPMRPGVLEDCTACVLMGMLCRCCVVCDR